MPTFIYTKKEFIAYLENQISKDEVIVLSNELTGNLSISKKGGIKVSHAYSSETFIDKGVGHIAFGKSCPLGIIVSKKERLSYFAKEQLKS